MSSPFSDFFEIFLENFLGNLSKGDFIVNLSGMKEPQRRREHREVREICCLFSLLVDEVWVHSCFNFSWLIPKIEATGVRRVLVLVGFSFIWVWSKELFSAE